MLLPAAIFLIIVAFGLGVGLGWHLDGISKVENGGYEGE